MSDGFQVSPNGEGFFVNFPCGLTISVQFSDGNYCEHYRGKAFPSPTGKPARSRDAEMAVFPTSERGGAETWIQFPRSHDSVLPFASVADFAKLVALLQGFTHCPEWPLERVQSRMQELVNEDFPEKD